MIADHIHDAAYRLDQRLLRARIAVHWWLAERADDAAGHHTRRIHVLRAALER